MSILNFFRLACIAPLAVLASCGGSPSSGDAAATLTASAPAPRLLAAVTSTAASGEALIGGPRANYSITRTDSGYSIQQINSANPAITTGRVATIRFSDQTVDLTIGAKARSIALADLNALIELYIAYFNRIPEAGGLGYWIEQFRGGMSIAQIGAAFYNAAVQYSALTGYTAEMGNADFVRLIYKNVLGRPNADQQGVDYWSGQLASGAATRGTLVNAMLAAAHGYKGDQQYGWVAEVLEYKRIKAYEFAVQGGLSYNSEQDSITQGMAMAQAITAESVTADKDAWGFGTGFNLLTIDAAILLADTYTQARPLVGSTLAFNLQMTTPRPGDFSGATTIYAYVVDDQGLLSEVVDIGRKTNNGWNAILRPAANLKVGRYRTYVQVNLCRDRACAQHFPGSPALVPLDLRVREPALTVSVNATAFTLKEGESLTDAVTFRPAGPAQSWTATSSASWLTLNNPAGFGNGSFTANISTAGLAKGSYFATVKITSADGQTVEQGVSLGVVTNQAIVMQSPLTLDLSPVNGAPPANAAFTFTMANISSVQSWSAITGTDWLKLTPAFGSIKPGETARFVPSVDAARMNTMAGGKTYTATLLIFAGAALQQSLSVTYKKP